MSLHRATVIFLAATGFCLAANSSHASTAGTLAFPEATRAGVQNQGPRNFPVTRTGGSTGAAGAVCTAVNGTAVAGTDFSMSTASLQWASGDATSKNCVITILDGTPFSGSKTFTLELTSVTGATLGSTSRETMTIYGNKGGGDVQLSAASYTVAENAGTVVLSVSRTGGSTGGAVVFYSTANSTAVAGTNYTKTGGMLAWQNGDASPKTISVPISDATAFSGSKTFVVALAAPENVELGSQTSSVVSITGAASTTTASATLSWSAPTTNTNGTPVTTLAGYHIYYGMTNGALNNSVAVSGASTTSYQVAGLTAGTWYFSIAADAADGTEGPQSSVGSTTIQ